MTLSVGRGLRVFLFGGVVVFLMRFITVAGPATLAGVYDQDLEATDVALPDASHACVAGSKLGGSFQILTVTNPVAPVFASALALPYPEDRLALAGEAAQRACAVGFLGGMRIISLADLESPLQLGYYDNGASRALDVAVSQDGNVAYVADALTGLEVVAITNPAAPVRLAQVQEPFSNQYNVAGLALAPDDGILYVAAEKGGLLVYSVTNPAVPVLQGQLYPSSGSGAFRDVLVSDAGDLIYVVGGDSSGDYAFHIVSVTNSAAPVLLACYADGVTGQAFADVAVSADGTTAFLVGDNVGLQIVDISRRGSVFFIDDFVEIIDLQAPQISGVALSADGRTAFLAAKGRGLRLVDVSGVYDIDDDGMPNFWEIRHFGSVTGGNASLDGDHDGANNLQEFIADTVPTNGNSVLNALGIEAAGNVSVSVSSSADRVYILLGGETPSSAKSNGVTRWTEGTGSLLNLVDTNGPPARFYRIGVALQE